MSNINIRHKVLSLLTTILAEHGGCMRISAVPTGLIREEFPAEERDEAEMILYNYFVTLSTNPHYKKQNPFHKIEEDGMIFICM